MNTSNIKRYSLILIVQYFILCFDICVNSFQSFFRQYPNHLLTIYVIQDFCLIVAFILLLVTFFSTYIFQVGLIQVLYRRFFITLVLCVMYTMLSIGFHTWHINSLWASPARHYWMKVFHTFQALHKTVLYYYSYKRASLRVADPRFYEASSWVEKQLSHS